MAKKVSDTKTGAAARTAKAAGSAIVTRGKRVVGNSQSSARPVKQEEEVGEGYDDDVDDDFEPEPEPDPRPRQSIKVRAKKDGYYDDKRRRIGDVFRVRPPYEHNVANADEPERVVTVNEFSKKWMVRVSKGTPERITTGKTVLQQHHDAEMKARRGEIDNPPKSEGVID